MATKILLPRLGESIEEAVIGKWCKEIGETVARGDVIAELETAKAMMELESPAKGVLLALIPEIGQTVQMGELVAVVGKEGEDWQAQFAAEEAAAQAKAAMRPKKKIKGHRHPSARNRQQPLPRSAAMCASRPTPNASQKT